MQSECTDQLGKGQRCNKRELHACEVYWEMVEGKYAKCSIHQKDGTVVQELVPVLPFQAPQRVGKNSFESPPENLSRGNAIDRVTFFHVKKLCNYEYALAHQQFIQTQDVHIREQHLMDINPLLCEIVGLDVHIQTHNNGIRSDVTCSGPRSKDFGDVDSWRKPALSIQDLVPK
jgi:hypothetical protein